MTSLTYISELDSNVGANLRQGPHHGAQKSIKIGFFELFNSEFTESPSRLMAGVSGKYRLAPEATIQASVGVETDTTMNNGSLSATGVTGLTAVNFNPNPVQTRPVAMLGGYYEVAKAQRVALTGIYRQEPYQAVGSTTVLATYTVGF